MSEKQSILVQLDTDPLPSVFDRVVAVDSGVTQIFSYGGVTPQNVMPLVHGCIFTRGPADLKRTAIFIGGSDVAAGEALLAEVKKHLIPAYGLTVSLMLDSNGSNTTAAAAVKAATKHVKLESVKSLILGGTGPVGQRIARLIAGMGGQVRLGSRDKAKAQAVANRIRLDIPNARIEAVATTTSADAPTALAGCEVVFAAGAPGVLLLPKKYRSGNMDLKVAIDLNGVPPAGIEGVEMMDRGEYRDSVTCYGAIGVGGTKMKIHRAAVAELFTKNNAVLDIDAIYEIAKRM